MVTIIDTVLSPLSASCRHFQRLLKERMVRVGYLETLGRIVTLKRVNTIADGLAASSPGTLSFGLAQRYVDRVITVEDDEMLHAIRVLFEWEHLLAEPAGAAGLAALLFHPSEVAAGRRVVVVVSGANVSEEVLVQALKSRRPG